MPAKVIFLVFVFFLSFFFPLTNFASTVSYPCSDSASIMSLVDRPSKADSTCTIPFKDAMVEMGYQYSSLIGGGNLQTLPQEVLRVGLPHHTEFVAILPTDNLQSFSPRAGFSATTLGLKKVFGYTDKWIWTAESLFTFHSGSQGFGSQDFGAALNGIVGYNFTSTVSATFMLGVTTQTLPALSGGERFNSINPDLLFSWQWSKKSTVFAEVYAQSKTAPGQGGGVNFDAGILYTLTKYIVIDAEVGQRGSGQLGGFNNYVGAGIGLLFS